MARAQRTEKSPPPQESRLREVGLYFLRLGATGFGGPLALIAQMEKDLGDRWIPREQFSQVFAAIKTMPGPFAFQVAVFLGFQRGGFAAALLTAVGLVTPSALLMLLFAHFRGQWSGSHVLESLSVGLQAAALGLIIASAVPLWRSAQAGDRSQQIAKWMFAIFGFLITLFRPSLEPVAILLCGVLALAPWPTLFLSAAGGAAALAVADWSNADKLTTLGLVSLKAGGLVFGSGLAIVPLLGSEFVDRLQWLTSTEFLEALMLGQITPGPMVITTTYIGYKVAGLTGALVATVGVFALPFVHMTTWFPRLWVQLSQSRQWRRFSFGAIAAVVGAVAASILKLLEPVALSVLEIDHSQLSRGVAVIALWVILIPASLIATQRKTVPAWAAILIGGLVSLAVLSTI